MTSEYLQGESLRKLLGVHVAKTATALVQNAGVDLYTVSGGRVLVTAFLGEVTTVIGANALTVKYQHTKSGGSAADLSAATTITSDAVGTLYGITGVAADLISVQTVAGTEVPNVTFLSLFPSGIKGVILPAGTLSILSSNADPDGGALKHDLFYIPLDYGASVVAA